MKINSFLRRMFVKPKAYFLTHEAIVRIAKEAKGKGIRYLPLHYVGVANADTSGEAITRYHKIRLVGKPMDIIFF